MAESYGELMLRGGKPNPDSSEAGQGGWWAAVQFLADLVVRESIDIWNDNYLSSQLCAAGYSLEDTQKSITWIQESSRSGRIQCTLGFIQEREMSRFRIENPTESAYLSIDLWKRLETFRLKGVISIGMMEKLLASLRTLDTRDWEEDEIEDFIDNVMTRNAESYSVGIEDHSESRDHYHPYC
jgi:hypothetical protein